MAEAGSAASRTTPAVRLREASFADHAGITRLEVSQGLKPKPIEEWRHLWTANPSYKRLGSGWPIGWVLEDRDGRVVGSLGNLPLPYVIEGRTVLVATGRGWAVEDQFRSYALLLMDEYFNQKRPDLFVNTTVNAHAAEAFGVFGSLRVPAGDWGNAAYFITHYRGFAESAMRIKRLAQPRVLSYPAGVVLSVKDRLSVKGHPQRAPRGGIDVEVARSFDERFDVFWKDLSRNNPALLAVRSREVLDWHFMPSIVQNQLWVITASKGSVIEGYGVFQRRDEPQYGLKRMRMVDFHALEGHAMYCEAIVARALEECRVHGIHALEHVGCDLERTRTFDQFAPYRRQLPNWSYFYLAREQALATHLASAEAWAPSSYDGDSSL